MKDYFDDDMIYSRIRHKSRSQYSQLECILKEWYGEVYGKIEIIAALPKVIAIKDSIAIVMEKNFDNYFFKLQKVKEKWKTIVGSQIVKISRPISFNKGLLSIEVDNSVWLMELKNYYYFKFEEKIINIIGKKILKKIIFVPKGK